MSEDLPPSSRPPNPHATIRDLPEEERPREKLIRLGPQALSEPELLALFFGSGRPGITAVELGRILLQRFGNLRKLAGSSIEELSEIYGIGPAKACQLAAVFELGNRLTRERLEDRPVDGPADVFQLLGSEMAALPYESLRIVLLNTRSRLIQVKEVTRGGMNESVAHPREILRAALTYRAYTFILVHNHPSGDPAPSAADRKLTKRLASASREIGVAMTDHVIIGAPSDRRTSPYFSFAEAGII